MTSKPNLNRLLHDVQSKCAALKSASQLLKDCPPDKAREMLSLMTKEAREILRGLFELQKELEVKVDI